MSDPREEHNGLGPSAEYQRIDDANRGLARAIGVMVMCWLAVVVLLLFVGQCAHP